MGIPQDIVGLLSNWLQNRIAYVEIDSCCSEFFDVTAGTVQGSVLGPILFNLFIRQLLVTHNPICFADDGYYYVVSKVKEEAIVELEKKIKEATDWLTASGMKVNITKTEFAVFHKSLSCTGRIRIGVESIEAKQDMGVLGIVFDNRLEWTKQVDKSILKARQSSQALRRIKNYFSETEINKLITSLVFSRMYYGSEIWLIPNLKERHFSRLYSQSGRSLKLINKEWSYRALHVSFSRATPKIFSLYQTCVNYYDLLHSQAHLEVENRNLQNVTLNDRRNKMLTFVRVNRYRAGLNNITNRLRSVTNMLDKTWINLSRDNFKSMCKKHIIQSQLQLLR